MQPGARGVFVLAKVEIDSLVAASKSASLKSADVVAAHTELPSVSAQTRCDLVNVYSHEMGVFLLPRAVASAKTLGGDLANRVPPWQAWENLEELHEQKLQSLAAYLPVKTTQDLAIKTCSALVGYAKLPHA